MRYLPSMSSITSDHGVCYAQLVISGKLKRRRTSYLSYLSETLYRNEKPGTCW